jgi:N-acetylglutamate synthase-like GNAT family acetyltransferase
MEIHIRLATEEDVPALRALIDASVRALQSKDYSEEQIDNALKTVFGVDSQLIADRTYFVAELAAPRLPVAGSAANKVLPANVMAGCGGWSRRKKLYGGDAWTAERIGMLDPAVDAAKIRAFFVAPACARMGVGTRILQACEDAAFAEGFRRFEMGATLTGVKLFAARGYQELERITLDIGGGERLPVVRMEKRV